MGLYDSILSSIMIMTRAIVSIVIRGLWVFPLKHNRIFFQSYEKANGYVCNPKYLCDFLKDNYPSTYELVFAMERDNKTVFVDGVKFIDYRSLRWFYYLSTSGIVVWNVRSPSYLRRRNGQLVINTWHAGGAYKRTGVIKAKSRFGAWANKKENEYITLFVSSSKRFTDTNIVQGFQYHSEILNCGMPRNDIFFSPDTVDSLNRKVRTILNIEDQTVVLFAPTFRGKADSALKVSFDLPSNWISTVLKDRFKKDVLILVRKHHHDNNNYSLDSNIIDVSNYPDMQELLCCADILITDYSSSIWDFALLKKPCFLYTPDLQKYENEDRGFFTPIEEWPGVLCRTADELINALKKTTLEESKAIAENHLMRMGSYENGYACKTITERIVQFSGKKPPNRI